MVNDKNKVTEIDSADDLFLPEVEEEEPGPSTVMDEDSVEIGIAEKNWEEKKNQKESELGYLTYYAVPAVGILLILSLGWTFAFIARRGLAPTASISTEDVIFEKQFSLKKSSPISGGMAKAVPREVAVPITSPFFIPLDGKQGRGRKRSNAEPTVFLNLSLNVLVSNKEAATEFHSKRTQIREEIFLHYNRLSPKDLETAESRERIRRELIEKINKKISMGKVKSILFQEFYTR